MSFDGLKPSPIKYVGGKSRLRSTLIPLIPKNAECYVEVFAGAAWLLFGKEPHAVEVLNDKNDDLVNLWRVMKWRTAELLEEVHKYLYSRTMFYALREEGLKSKCEIERACDLYLMIQMAFGADVSNIQSQSFGYRNKSRGDLFLLKSLEQFDVAKERLRGVFIECLDFEDLIKRYDQPDTIFYCDPPYYATCGYAEKFSSEDHERLANILSSIQGKFLLTIDNCEETRKLYSTFQVYETQESRGKSRETKGRQAADILIVRNYSDTDSMPLFSEVAG